MGRAAAAGGDIVPTIPPMEWARKAACQTVDPELFFPVREDADPAKQVCAGCPVADDCLRFALATKEPAGVWGGLTTSERKVLLGGRRRGRPKRAA